MTTTLPSCYNVFRFNNLQANLWSKAKSPHAVALGTLGGTERAQKLSAAERLRIAHKAANARMTTMTAEERHRVAMMGVEAKRKKRQEQGANEKQEELGRIRYAL